MNIEQHPANKSYFIVKNPTAEAVATASKLAQGNWARVEKSGNLTVHVNHRSAFERMIAGASTARKVFVTREEHEDGIGVRVGWNIVENGIWS